ncbi:MAG: hypothetical protein AB8B64_22855 [Granulosicoccus sp.]
MRVNERLRSRTSVIAASGRFFEKGLYPVANPAGAFDQLCDTYNGKSRFCRGTRDLFDTH